MSAFKIKTISHAIEDISGFINARGKLSPADRDIMREAMMQIRDFLGACEMNREEIELCLACNNRKRRRLFDD